MGWLRLAPREEGQGGREGERTRRVTPFDRLLRPLSTHGLSSARKSPCSHALQGNACIYVSKLVKGDGPDLVWVALGLEKAALVGPVDLVRQNIQQHLRQKGRS